MISKKMNIALNSQLEMESYASNLYLSIASWCDHTGLVGCKAFFLRQSEEERMHMTKLFEYILEMDGSAIVPGIDKPQSDFDSILSVFESTYEHEQMVTNSINDLVELAGNENDHATFNFLQWYVEEQREEESLIRDILDKIALIGTGDLSLYYIDKEVKELSNNQAPLK